MTVRPNLIPAPARGGDGAGRITALLCADLTRVFIWQKVGDIKNPGMEIMQSYDVCECGAPLRLMERPTPKPTGTEVLLKVTAAGRR